MGISRFTSKEFVIFCQASKIGNVFNYKMMESAELPKQPTTLQKSMMNPMNVLKIASFEVLISQSHGKNVDNVKMFPMIQLMNTFTPFQYFMPCP